ncbi:zinc ribbon domain-containing protein [Noviherbaspirillum malthae]|uniref:zinc ribbon domain-containing protein n=1 Tax=Noviherbaspirillum malthae TaxID=1260987 RepID=UPI00188F022A
MTHKANQAGISSFTGSERGTSSRCLLCGHPHKPKSSNWRCKACRVAGHRGLVGSVKLHDIAFWRETDVPRTENGHVRRPNTSAMRMPVRSHCPDLGRGAGDRVMSLHGRMDSTTGIVGAAKEAGHLHCTPSEAPSL